MGFGFLLTGYITAFVLRIGMGSYGFAAVMLGYFLMFLGFSRLKEYNSRFAWAQYMTIPMLLISVFSAVSWMNDMFLWSFELSAVNGILDPVKYGVELALQVMTLSAIASLSREVELPKITGMAYTAIPTVSLIYGYMFLVFFLGVFGGKGINLKFLTTLEVLLCLLFYIYMAFVLFRCYIYICPEGEEDMKPKPSRIGFINKIRAKQDEQEARAMEDAKRFVEERNRRRKQKKKKKK